MSRSLRTLGIAAGFALCLLAAACGGADGSIAEVEGTEPGPSGGDPAAAADGGQEEPSPAQQFLIVLLNGAGSSSPDPIPVIRLDSASSSSPDPVPIRPQGAPGR